MSIYAERIEAIRTLMREANAQAVIISGSDPHASEYVAPRWHQVAWVSGYTGEGEMVITEDHVGLWTDSRYFIQANKQLAGTGIELHKTRVPNQVLIPEWLAAHLEEVASDEDDEKFVCIMVDDLCLSASDAKDIESAFADANKKCVFYGVSDMLDQLWHDRPAVPNTPISRVSAEMCGMSVSEKIAWLRSTFAEKRCNAMLITALDEIAWLLNVRGRDVDYNPVVMSYLLVTTDSIQWFVRKSDDVSDLTASSFASLESEGVEVLAYEDVAEAIDELMQEDETQLYTDPSTINCAIYHLLDDSRLIEGVSPIQFKKSVKTAVEVEGMRKAHILDGIAVTKFLRWLEGAVASGASLSEWDGAVKLGEFRSELEGYQGDSFETVSSWGEGAALPHYVTPKDGSTKIGNHGLFLCDSGGQFDFGTTDITRTIGLGECTQLEKEDYTLVLKGHIALALAVFPRGTTGDQLDVLAREPMWRTYRNFGHGTGHGVGFYLNVHEGPQSIRQGFNRTPMLPGMITSNEPGIYREGMHGVRHENLILCVDTGARDFDREWLKFETITMCYFDTAPLIVEMLTDEEITWLNDYNALVYETLKPHLDAETAAWLKVKTAPVSR